MQDSYNDLFSKGPEGMKSPADGIEWQQVEEAGSPDPLETEKKDDIKQSSASGQTGQGSQNRIRNRADRNAGSRQKKQKRTGQDEQFWSVAPFSLMKWAGFYMMAFLLIVLLTGKGISNAPYSSVEEAVLSAADLSIMQKADNQMIRRLYRIDPSTCEGIVLYYPLTNMGAEELLLVKMGDPSQKKEIETAIMDRLQSQKNSFEGYGAAQTDMLSRSIVNVHGNYALFISAPSPYPVNQAFEKAL